MKDRFKIVVGIPKKVEEELNEWAASMPNAKLKRTQLAAVSGSAAVAVLCTYEDADSKD